ncbi:hypothetical protein PAXRUDRAFT_835370 [Paxillus rubicundulus Ve08.2h10]|uniref:XPG-I domain-containing protein n=1 Tax=Paxillus rubicundulus Ve08.2h10 TaxID=930991 RepID=A0A0D0D7Y0_9AGAM|nr:hypothetical protein PAXRUDRAFT_835370 [Paxillus rubicundulus Ve08.2h10]
MQPQWQVFASKQGGHPYTTGIAMQGQEARQCLHCPKYVIISPINTLSAICRLQVPTSTRSHTPLVETPIYYCGHALQHDHRQGVVPLCCACHQLPSQSSDMGIQGLWPILSRAAKKQSLVEYAANEVFHPRNSPNGGLKLLMIGGPHWLSRGFQELLDAFGFWWCEAPGKAKAELATLTQRGLIDMALTMDNDVLIFGATCVTHCPDDPQHFDNIKIYTEGAVMGCICLMHADLIFMALIGGGDYDIGDDVLTQEGIQGCGIKIAHCLSQYKLGGALWDAFTTMPDQEFTHFLYDGLLGWKYTKLASMIPNSFPNPAMLQSYASPLTTFSVGSENPAGSLFPYLIESQQPDLGVLATFCDWHFGCEGDAIITKMRVTIWEGATLLKKPGDHAVFKSVFKFVHQTVMDTTGLKLVVFKLQYHGRQFADAVWAALSLPPSEIISKLDGPKGKELVFLTLPACVIEYTLPADAQCFTEQCTEKMLALDAGHKAQERVKACAFMWDAGPESLPVPSGSQVSQST